MNSIFVPSGDQARSGSVATYLVSLLSSAIGIHHVDVSVAIPIAIERDLASVGRPTRYEVAGQIVGEARRLVVHPSGNGVHHVDLSRDAVPAAQEFDPFPVRRLRGVTVRHRVVGGEADQVIAVGGWLRIT
jgi:hypothetical protein